MQLKRSGMYALCSVICFELTDEAQEFKLKVNFLAKLIALHYMRLIIYAAVRA